MAKEDSRYITQDLIRIGISQGKRLNEYVYSMTPFTSIVEVSSVQFINLIFASKEDWMTENIH